MTARNAESPGHEASLTLCLLSGTEDSRQEWLLWPAEMITLGRSPDCDVLLEGDVVSRLHGTLTFVDGEFLYRNVGRHGTFVNGRSIDEISLVDGMELRIAKSGPVLGVRCRQQENSLATLAAGSISGAIEDLRSIAQADEEEAARQLWNRYFHQLAERGRAQTTHRSEDLQEDLAAEALSELLMGLRAGRFPMLVDRDGLWRMLVTVMARRSIDTLRKSRRVKRGSGLVAVETDLAGIDRETDGALNQAVSRDPTPEDLAALREELHRCFDRLDSEELRRTARLKLDGHTHPEIAKRLGVDLRTVERRVARIRELWFESTNG